MNLVHLRGLLWWLGVQQGRPRLLPGRALEGLHPQPFAMGITMGITMALSAGAAFVGLSGEGVDAVRGGSGQSDHFRSIL